MDEFMAFFENLPTWFRASLLIGGLMLFWVMEGVVPLYKINYKRLSHAGINLALTLINMIIGLGLASVLLLATNYTESNGLGILRWIELPLWAEILAGVMILDLIGAYFVHWSEHKIKWMWQIHLVHHSDTNVDVTTGLRHHPGEMFLRIGFTILAALIAGTPMAVVVLYQSLSVLFTHLTHANINMPDRLDRILSLIFVTPNMHKVHHHFQLPLTNTNYGNIFSLWDRLFGTYAYVNKGEVIYGLDTHPDEKEHSRLAKLLGLPFQKYRPPIKK